ncbi:Mitotic-spindle organizing gamma-tubulin ring associated [Popillia japonica]|uniref:Mitotic-spindle organizing gamma-tubulin ring associated n=1 Tax=Popillia japonica TaxID=7064 RepID=A0AAW1MBS7_POPJA
MDKLSKFSINLQPHQEELLQLSELAGIHCNPSIFHIIIELLNMQVETEAIYKMLKSIRKSYKLAKSIRKSV